MSNARNRAQQLQDILEGLVTGTPDVAGCAAVSEDGLIIGSVLAAETEEDAVGGMSSILLSLGARAVAELDLGELSQVLIRAEEGNVLLVKAGDGALLLTLMTRRAKLGLVFLDVKRAAKAISEII